MTALRSEISDLRSRVRRKREAGRSTFREVERLRLLVIEELRGQLDSEAREQARDRREPGSFQREIDFDD